MSLTVTVQALETSTPVTFFALVVSAGFTMTVSQVRCRLSTFRCQLLRLVVIPREVNFNPRQAVG